MFDGKMKEFRQEGNILKTEEEKKAMAEKHRFKKNREFKKRMDENEANEKGDIRSFIFHKHNPAYEEDFMRRFRKKDDNDRRAYRDDDTDRGPRDNNARRGGKGRDGFKKGNRFQGKDDYRKPGKSSFDQGERGGQKPRRKTFNKK
jgi:putative N6-adenine-specific DNA methylase